MKKASPLHILLLFLLAVSCSKKNDDVQKPTDDFSFYADGNNYTIATGYFFYLQNPVTLIPRIRPAGPGFFLTAKNNNVFDVVLSFTGFIKTDKLEAATYDFAMHANFGYSGYDSSTNCTVTITKIVNNKASGFFSGTVYNELSPWVNSPPTVITNGKFENIPIQN